MNEPRVAVVTGGAQGIGKAVGQALAAAGFSVALTDIQHDRVEATAQELSSDTGARVRGYAADVTDLVAVEASVGRIHDELGRVDVLVNNAGIITSNYVPAEEVSEEDFDLMMATHVKGAFLYSKSVIPYMKRQKYGRIVMVSSVVGALGFTRRIGYSTAKTAVLGLTRSLAVETGRWNITVNCISPGYILTQPIADRVAAGDLDEEALLARVPLARWGRPEDIAGVIGALTTPAFDYVTGTEIPVDGGYRIQGDYLRPDLES
ncbi:hypothetical protein A4U64_27125 (plasmid) [Rhodococcus sp. WB1]|uniref:SDR family NAD(P)-dependent oxidoreductase n=1 Tax=Rhodococcus sp. WB1 TaxID=1033922 RepID=UPI00081AAFB2|nr:SDR family NAD(P)-dependent oxidoreductase [Rhodococcus sp. WB1]ANZ28552.1 hypothetical protein A4U64_27125 [Rhodococcus sp. WB1]